MENVATHKILTPRRESTGMEWDCKSERIKLQSGRWTMMPYVKQDLTLFGYILEKINICLENK